MQDRTLKKKNTIKRSKCCLPAVFVRGSRLLNIRCAALGSIQGFLAVQETLAGLVCCFVLFFWLQQQVAAGFSVFHTLASSWAGLSSKELMSNKSLLAVWRDGAGCEISNLRRFPSPVPKASFFPSAVKLLRPTTHLTLSLCVFPVTQLCASSYRAITYYQSSGPTKRRMQGRSSIPDALTLTRIDV